MVNKQIIILKETELIELIKSSVKELQNEQFITFAVNPIYISSSPITVAATSNPITTTLATNSRVNWATTAFRYATNVQRQAISNTWRGAKHYTTRTSGGPAGYANIDFMNSKEGVGIVDFFHRLFVECEGWNECTRRGLDAIAIITAFIPGYGQVISIVAGLASGTMALIDGAYGEAAFSLTFELFPITRMFKRSAGVNIAEKEVADIIQKISQKELTQETVEQMSKELSKKQIKFIKNLADQDLKALDKEIMAAFNNPANKKMIDDLLGIQWDDVAQITGLNMTRQEFKIMQNTLKNQAKQMGVYDDIISNLNIFKRELKFVGTGIGTAIVSSVMVELGMSFFTDGLTEKDVEKIKVEMNLFDVDTDDLIKSLGENEKLWECFFNYALEGLMNGCSPAFVKWLRGTAWEWEKSKETNEELWDVWTQKRDPETLKDEVATILKVYWAQSTQIECKKVTFEKITNCEDGLDQLYKDLPTDKVRDKETGAATQSMKSFFSKPYTWGSKGWKKIMKNNPEAEFGSGKYRFNLYWRDDSGDTWVKVDALYPKNNGKVKKTPQDLDVYTDEIKFPDPVYPNRIKGKDGIWREVG